MARGPQKTTRLVRGGPLVTIILSNRTITTHNNGQYKTHYRYSRKSKTFVLNDCNVKIEVTEFGKEFQILNFFKFLNFDRQNERKNSENNADRVYSLSMTSLHCGQHRIYRTRWDNGDCKPLWPTHEPHAALGGESV